MTISTDFTKATAAKIEETINARGAVYAPPESNFKRIADFWSMWIKWRYGMDVPLNAFDAGMMQAGIKLARQAETPHHEDSALDGPAYWMLAVGCDHDLRVILDPNKGPEWEAFLAAPQGSTEEEATRAAYLNRNIGGLRP